MILKCAMIFFLLCSIYVTPNAYAKSRLTKLQVEKNDSEMNADSQAIELVFASWDQDLHKMKSLVSEGAGINVKAGPGLTALHCAKLRGNQEIVTWLMENGANPDIPMPAKNQIADMIFKKNADPNSPGGALAVIQSGSVIHESCYGLANLEHQNPITPTTVFELASVTKQFVGFAIATLVHQGKISLDEDIRKYIPELNDFGQTLKIDHLLHHTSGLRDWPGTLCLAGWDLDDVLTFDHILTMAFNQKGLNFDPGSEHLYSNTGYTLLVELVQRVTGDTFRDWVETNILQPLEMTNSHYHDDRTELEPGKAYGYASGKDNTFRAVPNNLVATGSASLHSTIDDMAKWAINLETHKIGGEAVFNVMYQQGILNSGEEISYAGGLDTGKHRGTKTISHGGGGAGFTTFVLYLPEFNFSAIVLYNINTNVYGAIYDIADVFLGEKLEPKPEKDQDNDTKEEFAVSDELLNKYIGTYQVFPAFYITISRDGSRLMALETNKEIYPISAISETEFWVAAWNRSLKFNVDDSGNVLDFDFLGRNCPKVEEGSTPSQSPLTEDLTGVYYSDELDVRYTIVIEDGQLKAKHRRHGTSNLSPAWKENFRGDWWFMRSVEFNRDENGIVDGFAVTQWQSRNHRFVKVKAGGGIL